jgi:hypothetical protein
LFFGWLGLPTTLPIDERPNLALFPPVPPSRQEVWQWWGECLAGKKAADRAKPARRARIVLMQGLILLTGMRLEEVLLALLCDVEGHWLLIRPERTKKREPRILYLNGQALAIASILRDKYNPPKLPGFEDSEQRLAGWQLSQSYFLRRVREAMPWLKAEGHDKPQQKLRQLCSDWLHDQSMQAHSHALPERLQLGHGGGVLFKHYLGVLEKLPPLLERHTLPPIVLPDGRQQKWPEPITAEAAMPKRLIGEFRRLVSRRRPT